MDTTEFEITMENGRIINVVAEKVSDDTWKVIVQTETFLDGQKSSIGLDEGAFCLVEASKLGLDDQFMQFEPITENEKNLKEAITSIIKSGVADFYHSPTIDLGCNDRATGYTPKNHEMSYEWWESEAKKLYPGRGSRLGVPKEYFAFLAAILKDLVSKGISVKKAWHAVCEDPKELEFFWKQITEKEKSSKDAKTKVFWGPIDFSKQVRILAAENANDGFWMVGINYFGSKDFNPLISMTHISSKIGEYVNTVGWIILTR